MMQHGAGDDDDDNDDDDDDDDDIVMMDVGNGNGALEEGPQGKRARVEDDGLATATAAAEVIELN
jgi:hypothetical protein